MKKSKKKTEEQKHREFYLRAAETNIDKLDGYIPNRLERRYMEEQLDTIAEYLGMTVIELKEYIKDIKENF